MIILNKALNIPDSGHGSKRAERNQEASSAFVDKDPGIPKTGLKSRYPRHGEGPFYLRDTLIGIQ
jgi:hypothetical protein